MRSIGLEQFKKTTQTPFLQTGFRPFFLLASLYAVIVMAMWGGIYFFQWPIKMVFNDSSLWHAHEMLYGYSMAVIGGFLLTSVRNWTRQQTADGNLLLSLVILWIIGRIPPVNMPLAYLAAFGDIFFGLFLALVIAAPILRRKLTKQWPVWLILILVSIFNITYYLGVFKVIDFSPRKVLYMSLFLILNLIFIFTRRLIPNFINSALRPKTPLKNRALFDKALIPLFLVFSVNEVFFHHKEIALLTATILLVFNVIRLYDWYLKGIWTRHLLWSLWLSYLFLTLVFVLKIMEYFVPISPFLSLHMFTIGGIALVTVSMMSRVSLGHTGRNILEEINATKWLFVGIVGTIIFRVLLPLFFPAHYNQLLGTSMIIWMITFFWFFVHFFKILIAKRTDGMYG